MIRHFLFLFWFFLISDVVRNSFVYPQIINVDPYACVNISLDKSKFKNEDKIFINLFTSDSQFVLSYNDQNKLLWNINYYFHKYKKAIGQSWIYLCNIDSKIDDHRIAFEVKDTTSRQVFISDTIKIKNCKYTTPCESKKEDKEKADSNIILLSPKPTQSSLKLPLEPYQIVKMSLCHIYKRCIDSTTEKDDISILLHNNMIKFSYKGYVLTLNTDGYNLSEYTLHFAYQLDDLVSIKTYEFKISDEIIIFDTKNNILNFSPVHPFTYRSYTIYYTLNTTKSLLHIQPNFDNFPIYNIHEGIKKLDTYAIELDNQNFSYIIIFFEFTMMSDQHFHYDFMVSIDYEIEVTYEEDYDLEIIIPCVVIGIIMILGVILFGFIKYKTRWIKHEGFLVKRASYYKHDVERQEQITN